MNAQMMPATERQRTLQSLTFSENQILSRDLPRDTILKSLALRLSGAVQTTFASGTPVADAQSTFDNIIPRIDVVVDGSRVVKSVRPHLMNMQALLTAGFRPERKSSAAAAAATGNNPLTDAGFTYGTTTQYTTVAETCVVSFEHAYAKYGRESTWLNLKGRSSAELKLTCAAFSKLLGYGNTAPVTYGNSTLAVEIFTKEAQDVPAEVVFSDWKQTTKEVQLSAESSDYAIDINRGNKLAGIMLFTKDGAAGSTTTATGKVASNLVLSKIQLLLNGQTAIKTTNFLALQSENRAEFGINNPLASSVSQFDGVAYLNLLQRGDLDTALDVRPPFVDNVQLVVSSRPSGDVSYTNPVSITLMTEEVVAPR